MPTPPSIPDAATEAAGDDLYERTVMSRPNARRLAGSMLTAALPALFPGLYVTRHDGFTVWRHDPANPSRPQPLGAVEMAEVLAGLIPDHTDDTEDADPLADVYVPCDACESSGQNCRRHRTAEQVIAAQAIADADSPDAADLMTALLRSVARARAARFDRTDDTEV